MLQSEVRSFTPSAISNKDTISFGECIYRHGIESNAVLTPLPETCMKLASVPVGRAIGSI